MLRSWRNASKRTVTSQGGLVGAGERVGGVRRTRTEEGSGLELERGTGGVGVGKCIFSRGNIEIF